MTKAERDLLMAVAAAVVGWGQLSDAERQEVCDLAGVNRGEDWGASILAKMRAVAAEATR